MKNILHMNLILLSVLFYFLFMPQAFAWDGDIGGGWHLMEPTVTIDWNSGYDKNLSKWKKVKCWKKFSDTTLLTGVEVFQEPKKNADNFIAKLNALCGIRVFNSKFGFAGNNTHNVNVFSANHRNATDSQSTLINFSILLAGSNSNS